MSARRERETSADGPFRNLGWARGDRNNPRRKNAGGTGTVRCRRWVRAKRHDTHGLATRSGSAAPASMARPGPGRGRAPGRRPSDATLSPISLGTRRETPSHHLDDTAHRPRHFYTRINTPRTVFCYIG